MAEVWAEEPEWAHLSAYRRCCERIRGAWPGFAGQRAARLRQGLYDAPVEKIAENVVEDLFTTVLDWSLDDVNLQVGRADVILSDHGFKRLVLEVKRPGALIGHRPAIESALSQARGYAGHQQVGAVAVSDGTLLYAADIENGGLRDRVLVTLDAREAPLDLWWVSVHGIYRRPPALRAWPAEHGAALSPEACGGGRLPGGVAPETEPLPLHPRYRLPVGCFAYVEDAGDPRTWKLPYLHADGTTDLRRLPKALQAILSNYRGAKVTLAREAVPDVLTRLALAARRERRLPCQDAATAAVYEEAHRAIAQMGRVGEVGCCAAAARAGAGG